MLVGSSVPGGLASVHPAAGIPVVEGEGHRMPAVVRIGPEEEPDPEGVPILGRPGTPEHLRRAKTVSAGDTGWRGKFILHMGVVDHLVVLPRMEAVRPALHLDMEVVHPALLQDMEAVAHQAVHHTVVELRRQSPHLQLQPFSMRARG